MIYGYSIILKFLIKKIASSKVSTSFAEWLLPNEALLKDVSFFQNSVFIEYLCALNRKK